MPMNDAQLKQQQDSAKVYQADYDEKLRQVGMRAPEPVLGQEPDDYRRETCRLLKRTFLPQNHPLYQVNYRGLRTDALNALEPQLIAAVVVEAFNPNNVPPGQFREIEKVNPHNGYKERHFIGPRSFVWDMTRVRGRTTLREMQRRADLLRMAK